MQPACLTLPCAKYLNRLGYVFTHRSTAQLTSRIQYKINIYAFCGGTYIPRQHSKTGKNKKKLKTLILEGRRNHFLQLNYTGINTESTLIRCHTNNS